ncbi:MAG: hypothetical protein H6900_11905 [Rhodobacter sp.]|nr:hypothetical protein [Paracoccaceae bacterium]MCC0073982.1 hypothetical protein [Rhodobacter sp.]
MFIFAGFLIGAVWGGIFARRKGGERLDIVQYAAVWGLIGAILGTVLTVVIQRAM